MSTHRTRQVEVEAFQWTGGPSEGNEPEWLAALIGKGSVRTQHRFDMTVWLLIRVDTGPIVVKEGDYVIRFPDGHIEKRTPEEFEAQFEPVASAKKITTREALEIIQRNIKAGAVDLFWIRDFISKTFAADDGKDS